uniref:Uncharacterized protein n=1 Tax=Entomoneis paludosa TaxID=265537 RepID=A0A7S2YK96_9STRA
MTNRLKDASAKIEAEDSAETRKSKEDKNERPDVKKPKRNDYHELKKDKEEVQESAVPDIQLAPVAIVSNQEKTGKSKASPAATETKDLSEASKAPDRANTQGMKTEVIEAMKTDTPETVVEDEDDDEDIPGIEFDAPPDAEDE